MRTADVLSTQESIARYGETGGTGNEAEEPVPAVVSVSVSMEVVVVAVVAVVVAVVDAEEVRRKDTGIRRGDAGDVVGRGALAGDPHSTVRAAESRRDIDIGALGAGVAEESRRVGHIKGACVGCRVVGVGRSNIYWDLMFGTISWFVAKG